MSTHPHDTGSGGSPLLGRHLGSLSPEGRSLDFWSIWLVSFFLAVAAMGCVLVAAPQGGPLGGIMRLAAGVFWPRDVPPGAEAFQRWVYAVLGATLAGWSLLGAWIARAAFARRERWARDALASSVALWFLLDTGVSMLAGVWVNVAFNVAVLIFVLPPLLFTWRQFAARA